MTLGLGLFPRQWVVFVTVNGEKVKEVELQGFPRCYELFPSVSVDSGKWTWRLDAEGDRDGVGGIIAERAMESKPKYREMSQMTLTSNVSL